jgi:hypothetical protein
MPEPATSGATAGAMLAKAGVFIGLMAAIGAGIGFAVAWPKNPREACVRFAMAVLGSFLLGPILALVGRHYLPFLFEDAATASIEFFLSYPSLGVDAIEARFIGWLLMCGPFMVAGALPFWWLTRWVVNWMEKHRNKDISQIAKEVKPWL